MHVVYSLTVVSSCSSRSGSRQDFRSLELCHSETLDEFRYNGGTIWVGLIIINHRSVRGLSVGPRLGPD